jgi:membrane-associated phospholipid phosphatase
MFWHLLTRLGEAQILLPAMLLASAWLALRPGSRRLAAVWLTGTALATLITTASKVAFIGHGLGWAGLDFTGVSGHAMFAAAVLPPLLRLAAAALPPAGQRAGAGLGYALAAAVAVSRVMVQAHSWSEVGAGFALGAAASGAVLWTAPMPPLRFGRWLPAALLGWGLLGVLGPPTLPTHGWVTRLALAQSGRDQPYRRDQMHPTQPPDPPRDRQAPRSGVNGAAALSHPLR